MCVCVRVLLSDHVFLCVSQPLFVLVKMSNLVFIVVSQFVLLLSKLPFSSNDNTVNKSFSLFTLRSSGSFQRFVFFCLPAS